MASCGGPDARNACSRMGIIVLVTAVAVMIVSSWRATEKMRSGSVRGSVDGVGIEHRYGGTYG